MIFVVVPLCCQMIRSVLLLKFWALTKVIAKLN